MTGRVVGAAIMATIIAVIAVLAIVGRIQEQEKYSQPCSAYGDWPLSQIPARCASFYGIPDRR